MESRVGRASLNASPRETQIEKLHLISSISSASLSSLRNLIIIATQKSVIHTHSSLLIAFSANSCSCSHASLRPGQHDAAQGLACHAARWNVSRVYVAAAALHSAHILCTTAAMRILKYCQTTSWRCSSTIPQMQTCKTCSRSNSKTFCRSVSSHFRILDCAGTDLLFSIADTDAFVTSVLTALRSESYLPQASRKRRAEEEPAQQAAPPKAPRASAGQASASASVNVPSAVRPSPAFGQPDWQSRHPRGSSGRELCRDYHRESGAGCVA